MPEVRCVLEEEEVGGPAPLPLPPLPVGLVVYEEEEEVIVEECWYECP